MFYTKRKRKGGGGGGERETLLRALVSVWYMHLKTENMCLQTCVEIYVGEKICGNTCNVV